MRQAALGIVLTALVFLGESCVQDQPISDPDLTGLREATGLTGERLFFTAFTEGQPPKGFADSAGAAYKPSFNEDPAIPVQCWVETGYGTQNACQYCHTNALFEAGHGNAMPLAEDQILYSFPSPNLNKVNWRNIIHPEEILKRLEAEGITVPRSDDPANLDYVRTDNWSTAYKKARSREDDSWNNLSHTGSPFQLFPSLDPNHLFPYAEADPTGEGRHGYVDPEGFVRDRSGEPTGWRAVNFFPYAIFTPLTGSVSGIYIRLPRIFMSRDGTLDMEIYKRNLDLLDRNIKNRAMEAVSYAGDASSVAIRKGFYPLGTEFAHPLHYVDPAADGEWGSGLDGAPGEPDPAYEFPGTRARRVKEIRYMYKWKEVGLEDLTLSDGEAEEVESVLGREGQGWIDNTAGWILAASIENRSGDLRPQTTEELIQCLGCHSAVGNTVDAVWSFQRRLPGELGWREMDYGMYSAERPERTRLRDYLNPGAGGGEMEYFYSTVVGADLFGVMPEEIKAELVAFVARQGPASSSGLDLTPAEIFDDDRLKRAGKAERKAVLKERMRIMRHYASRRAYLYHDPETDADYIKGTVFYPFSTTVLANIAGYRRIVLDQSFNLGKNVFGSQPGAIPFTFRSDGEVLDSARRRIPAGDVIESRPWGEDGIGLTPTGIVRVDKQGRPVDKQGRPVDIEAFPEKADGHVSAGGTFQTRYNPILADTPVRRKF